MTKQARAERTRQHLIEAATELLAEKGTVGTTFDAIADASRMSRGCIRFHFGNKQGLLLTVVEQAFAEYEQHIETHLIRSGDNPSSISDVLQSHRDFIQQNETVGRLFFILLFEALGPNPELLPWFVDHFSRIRKLTTEWIEAARRTGVISSDIDIEALASIVLGVFGGLRCHWYVDREHMDLDRIYTTLSDILERSLSAPPTTEIHSTMERKP